MERLKASDVRIDESWKTRLSGEFESDYFAGLKAFLTEEKKKTCSVSTCLTHFFGI